MQDKIREDYVMTPEEQINFTVDFTLELERALQQLMKK